MRKTGWILGNVHEIVHSNGVLVIDSDGTTKPPTILLPTRADALVEGIRAYTDPDDNNIFWATDSVPFVHFIKSGNRYIPTKFLTLSGTRLRDLIQRLGRYLLAFFEVPEHEEITQALNRTGPLSSGLFEDIDEILYDHRNRVGEAMIDHVRDFIEEGCWYDKMGHALSSFISALEGAPDDAMSIIDTHLTKILEETGALSAPVGAPTENAGLGDVFDVFQANLVEWWSTRNASCFSVAQDLAYERGVSQDQVNALLTEFSENMRALAAARNEEYFNNQRRVGLDTTSTDLILRKGHRSRFRGQVVPNEHNSLPYAEDLLKRLTSYGFVVSLDYPEREPYPDNPDPLIVTLTCPDGRSVVESFDHLLRALGNVRWGPWPRGGHHV